jgi:hypothetical protein
VGPRAGLNMEKRKFFTLSGVELTALGGPARSQSLYRLRYPGFQIYIKIPQVYRSNVEASKMWSDNTFSLVRINLLIKFSRFHKHF